MILTQIDVAFKLPNILYFLYWPKDGEVSGAKLE
jgi:hypothetical protein